MECHEEESFVRALRTILRVDQLFDKGSSIQLDERSKETVEVLQKICKENGEKLENLADFLEASISKNKSMGRLAPGRQHLDSHKVDSGLGSSENRLSNITPASSNSIHSEDPTVDKGYDEGKELHLSDDKTDEVNQPKIKDSSCLADLKFSASSSSSVFGSETEMSKVNITDVSGLNNDSEKETPDKIKEDASEGKTEKDIKVGKSESNAGSKCIFTLGTPPQSLSAVECGTDLSANGVAINGGHHVTQYEGNMNIPSDTQREKIINTSSRKYSREEFLSRYVSSATNDLTLQGMLEPRENSTSSESDNLPSSGSEGSICIACGARRGSQRPSVDINSPLFY